MKFVLNLGGRIKHVYSIFEGFSVNISPAEVNNLKMINGIGSIEEDQILGIN
jgi:hypothetical protein